MKNDLLNIKGVKQIQKKDQRAIAGGTSSNCTPGCYSYFLAARPGILCYALINGSECVGTQSGSIDNLLCCI